VRRAIAIDLDGTLLDSARGIGALSLRMIERAASLGWVIIISTARPVRAIKLALPEMFRDFYWAACNGAWVLRAGEIIRRTEIPGQTARRLVAALGGQRLRVLVEAEDRMFANQALPAGWGECYPLEQFRDANVCKVLVDIRSPEELDTIRRVIPPECAYVVTDGGELAQIAHQECNKLNAVKFILDREGVALSETIAFGDDNNDIELVQAVGCGVAMGNATARLKAIADHVTLTNDEDGVGRFLEAVLDNELLS
jgi:5-amino-6-(5-phospho-D-ribitylamino)uracil phosphatase